MSNTDIQPITQPKFTVYEVDDFIDNNYQRTLGDDTVRRIVKSLNSRTYANAIERITALDDQVRTEISELPPIPAAVRRLRELAPPENLVIDLEGPHPWFERNRPAWSNPDYDHLDTEAGSTGTYGSAWWSESFDIPSREYYGRAADGKHLIAKTRFALTQKLRNAEPHIVLTRLSCTPQGEWRKWTHTLALDEALTVAHILLNLVDLAQAGDSDV